MCCVGKSFAATLLATITACAAFVHFTSVDAAQPDAKEAKEAKDAKVDLTALREAVAAAAKRGANVEEIRNALDTLAKAAPTAKAGAVSTELQALRDAVDAAARKGENVEAVAKELTAVEIAIAGKPLAKPRPEPRPEPQPEPRPRPRPEEPLPFPAFPFPNMGKLNGGIDVQMFDKAAKLREKALELMRDNPRNPEGLKLWAEANELMLKSAGVGGADAKLLIPLFEGVGRVPDRARFGIRMERVPTVAAEQLGLEPNTGVVVSSVMPDSVAAKAGIKANDIILEFAGKPVSDKLEELIQRVNDVKDGEKVDVVVLRKGKKIEVKGIELPTARR